MNIEHHKSFKQELIEFEIQQLIGLIDVELAKTLYNTLERVYDIGYREGSVDGYYNHPDVGC